MLQLLLAILLKKYGMTNSGNRQIFFTSYFQYFLGSHIVLSSFIFIDFTLYVVQIFSILFISKRHKKSRFYYTPIFLFSINHIPLNVMKISIETEIQKSNKWCNYSTTSSWWFFQEYREMKYKTSNQHDKVDEYINKNNINFSPVTQIRPRSLDRNKWQMKFLVNTQIWWIIHSIIVTCNYFSQTHERPV